MVNSGYFLVTTIVSDGQSEFVFKVDARWVEFSNLIFLIFKGNTDTRPSKQRFFNNICEGEQFFRGAYLSFTSAGSAAFR